MPAHCSASSAGKKLLSNGFPLHAIDIAGNAYCDKWAKAAAAAQSLPKSELKRIADAGAFLTEVAKWIGICTTAANRCPFGMDAKGKPFFIRDAEADILRTPRKIAKRKRVHSPVVERIAGDLSMCPKWQAIRMRIRHRAGAS